MRRLFLGLTLTVLLGAGCGSSVTRRADDSRPPLFTSEAQATTTLEAPADTAPKPPETTHVPLPAEVRGIYWTAVTAGSSRGDALLAYMKRSGLNAAVIDLKLDDGEIGFTPKDPALIPLAQDKPVIRDLDALLEKLRVAGMYRIARIPIMKDSSFATIHPEAALKTTSGGMWRDKTGVMWIDPTSPIVASTTIALAREAHSRGFDEVQFDYIRFPSDGVLKTIVYPDYKNSQTKPQALTVLFDRLGALRAEGIPVSFDLFGMTFWNTNDFGIGQRLQDVWPNADFVSPMVYPSHYPSNFQGFRNPAEHPYEIVKRSLDKGVETLRLTFPLMKPEEATPKFRPWIQDFDIGATYTADKIEAQIKAARDGGASGFLIWNARNVYQSAVYH